MRTNATVAPNGAVTIPTKNLESGRVFIFTKPCPQITRPLSNFPPVIRAIIVDMVKRQEKLVGFGATCATITTISDESIASQFSKKSLLTLFVITRIGRIPCFDRLSMALGMSFAVTDIRQTIHKFFSLFVSVSHVIYYGILMMTNQYLGGCSHGNDEGIGYKNNDVTYRGKQDLQREISHPKGYGADLERGLRRGHEVYDGASKKFLIERLGDDLPFGAKPIGGNNADGI